MVGLTELVALRMESVAFRAHLTRYTVEETQGAVLNDLSYHLRALREDIDSILRHIQWAQEVTIDRMV